jgi:hypothetical protein
MYTGALDMYFFKAKSSGFIFGGYTEAKWQSFGRDKSNPNAFIFSLINKDNKPCKMNVSNPIKAIYCSSRFGPIFGGSIVKEGKKLIKGAIRVADNGNVNMESVSFLGDAYKYSSYFLGVEEADSFLAGSYKFRRN